MQINWCSWMNRSCQVTKSGTPIIGFMAGSAQHLSSWCHQFLQSGTETGTRI